MSTRIKYPSLYADVVPVTTSDHKRGSRVVCTATGQPLGFVWWSCNASSVVTWHFRTTVDPTPEQTSGERNSERNAVQALRDVANGGHLALALQPPDDDRAERVARTAAAVDARPGWGKSSPVVEVVVADAPVVRQHIKWGDSATDAADLTAALAAALARHQRS